MEKEFTMRKLKYIGCTLLCICMMFIGSMMLNAAEVSVNISCCKITDGGEKVTVKAKLSGSTKEIGSKLYLMKLSAYEKDTGIINAKPIASVKVRKGTVTFLTSFSRGDLYKKYALAKKTSGHYMLLGKYSYITNPEVIATYRGKGPKAGSKKGLQVEEISDSLEIGTKHAVINWTLSSLLCTKDHVAAIPVHYKKKTYYFDGDVLAANDALVKVYNENGVRVTIILLLPMDGNKETASMRYDTEPGAKFSSFKTTTKNGCETFEAVMTYLALRYGTKEKLVCGWILGNEVDSPCVWNYAGGKSLQSYINDYARAFRICYNATRSVSSYTNVYISLDHNWNTDWDGNGTRFFSTKSTLDTFYQTINRCGKIPFRIAYHAYPQGLADGAFWDDDQAIASTKAKIINFKNIHILTNYVKKKMGSDYKIMFSEQSFNTNRGDIVQAAAYAYAYYLSEGNSMVEAFIYGREFDNIEEGYHWGLCTNNHQKRLLWSVFQYIDSEDSLHFTNPLVKYTGLKSWKSVKGFSESKYKKMPSLRKIHATITELTQVDKSNIKITWEKRNKSDGYLIYRKVAGEGEYKLLARIISGNSTVSYVDTSTEEGQIYYYKVRTYKKCPQNGQPEESVDFYGYYSKSAKITTVPDVVTWKGDKITVSGNDISLRWKSRSVFDRYEILRSTSQNDGYEIIADTDRNTYKDENLCGGVVYYYKVRGYLTRNKERIYSSESEIVKKKALIKCKASYDENTKKMKVTFTEWKDAIDYQLYCAVDGEVFTGLGRMAVIKESLSWSGDKVVRTRTDEVTGEQIKEQFTFEPGHSYRFRIRAHLGKDADGKNIYGTFSAETVDVVIPKPTEVKEDADNPENMQEPDHTETFVSPESSVDGKTLTEQEETEQTDENIPVEVSEESEIKLVDSTESLRELSCENSQETFLPEDIER